MAEIDFSSRPAGTDPRFGLVFVAINTFFLLTTREAQQRCLQRCARCWSPKAGSCSKPSFRPSTGRRTSSKARTVALDHVILTATRHDPIEQTVTSQYIELRESGIRMRPLVIRYAPSPSSTPWPPPRAFSWSTGGATGRARRSPIGTTRTYPSIPRHRLPSRAPRITPLSQLRLNPLTGRWVTIAAERSSRPGDFAPRMLAVEADSGRPCPFCPGNEESTPPALETYGPSGQWQVRVVPNLYPAFSGDEPMTVSNLGPVFTQASASGIHEVLVLSPDHGGSFADLDDRAAGLVMAAVRDRMEEHARHANVRYTQAIVNHGRRPARRSPIRTGNSWASRSCPASWPKSGRASCASRDRACSARWPMPRCPPVIASCTRTSASWWCARSGAAARSRCWRWPRRTRPISRGRRRKTWWPSVERCAMCSSVYGERWATWPTTWCSTPRRTINTTSTSTGTPT